MLVVMHRDATPDQVARVLAAVREMGLTPHPLPGSTRTAVGITGNLSAVDPGALECLPGVLEMLRVTKPYKLASREMRPADTVVTLPQTKIGPGTFTVIAGPCSVENEAMILRTAEFLRNQGINLMRAGAFKPRSSPYSFQGLGQEGLDILVRARDKTGIGIVTELMDTENTDAVEAATDIIQIGTRNMQNFSLLRRVSKARKPVLLKRGLSATLEEWLMAAEYTEEACQVEAEAQPEPAARGRPQRSAPDNARRRNKWSMRERIRSPARKSALSQKEKRPAPRIPPPRPQ